jgi:hypothetical protein
MLTDHKNDLFVTHETMPSALRYVNDLCSAAASQADSIAIRTAAHIILNTAIEMHRAEKQVLVDKINELSTNKDPVTALLTLVREQVTLVVSEQSHAVTAAVDEQIENWMADNLQDHVEKCIDMDEKIAEQIGEYFSSNYFSIEPR